MTKSIYNYPEIHQSYKLHGILRHGFQPCRRALAVFFMATISVLTSFAQTLLTEATVYNRLMERQNMEGYTEGTPWDNSHTYYNTVEFFGYPANCYGGGGCFAFMMDMMEYASNYDYPIRKVEGTYDNLPKIRVGDGVRVKNNAHSVVVLEVLPDGHTVIVAEGNYNSKVHWGRKIDLADASNGFTYLATFWPEVDVTIDATGYATFYYSNCAFVIPQGVTASAVENISGKTINLTPVTDIIPAGYAVILEGEPGKYTFESTPEVVTPADNMLRGTDETELINSEDQDCKYYKLAIKHDVVGFYYGAENGAIFENQAHKAYLPVPVSQANGINCFFFDAATGIDKMQATDENTDHAIYNLSGQRVSDSYKGVVIINGKKVLRR